MADLITSAEIPDEWIATVREALHKGQYDLRGNGLSIEARSATQNRWHVIMLFGSGYAFATEADRDAVLARIRG